MRAAARPGGAAPEGGFPVSFIINMVTAGARSSPGVHVSVRILDDDLKAAILAGRGRCAPVVRGRDRTPRTGGGPTLARLQTMEPVRVAHLMSTHLLTLFAEQTLPIAEELMKLKRLRHIPVIDDAGRLVGLVSHRDLLRAQYSDLTGLDVDDRRRLESRVPVSSIMTVDVWTVHPDMLASKAGELLLDNRFGCLPVIDAEQRLIGVLTEADFLRFAIKALEIHDPK